MIARHSNRTPQGAHKQQVAADSETNAARPYARIPSKNGSPTIAKGVNVNDTVMIPQKG